MGRTLIIGDVHGCRIELEELLSRAAFATGDRLCLVGDLIARGPDSAGVLDLARQLDATCVLGNHELRMLDANRARSEGRRGRRLGPAHYQLLHQLEPRDFEMMATFPLYVELAEHSLSIVHAGVIPGVPLDQQDAWVLTHLRSFDDDGTPTDRLGEQSWAERYLPSHGAHLVFGHNSRARLQLWPNATGLDTGCVYGGELTALVLASGESVAPIDERRDQLLSVRARDAYYGGVPLDSARTG